MKLYIATEHGYIVNNLPEHVSKELMLEKLRLELSNNNVTFIELIENGESVFINKNKIVKISIEENE